MEHSYYFILFVAVTWFCTALTKLFVRLYRKEKNKQTFFLQYGGFPSAHASFVTSIAVSVFLLDGLSLLAFVCACYALLTIRDVITLRGSIDRAQKKGDKKISHSPLEIFVGFLYGIIIPILLWFFFFY